MLVADDDAAAENELDDLAVGDETEAEVKGGPGVMHLSEFSITKVTQ